jgi:diguanylate cyclase (GGDEF)-like protein
LLQEPSLKQWVKKLFDQFEVEWDPTSDKHHGPHNISEEKATLLYIIDTYNKHLFDLDNHPVRKVRETLDEFAKSLLQTEPAAVEKALFRFRQFFSSYRIDEYSYIQNAFDEFKTIIWDFADQLAEDVRFEQVKDGEVKESLEQLKEAVEANSIDDLRTKSREFIDFYVEYQTKKDERRSRRISAIQSNLQTVKKQLVEANETARTDHLTGAFNRRSFDEHLRQMISEFQTRHTPVSLIMLDIDHFKKINDAYGHDLGDFVIQACVRLLKETFHRGTDFVARVGGEEFAVVVGHANLEVAHQRAEEAMAKIRKEVFIQGNLDIRFTVSMGIAQLTELEARDQWVKRADEALYHSKNTGRNKITLAPAQIAAAS